MIAENDKVLDLIPQRSPMVMIHKLVSCDDENTVSNFTVLSDNIFIEDGCIAAAGLVENIAQTAAARVGYICQQQQIPVPLGFIGAVKNLEVSFLPKINSILLTKVKITHQVFDVTVIEGIIYCNDHIAAKCEMKIFIQKNKN